MSKLQTTKQERHHVTRGRSNLGYPHPHGILTRQEHHMAGIENPALPLG